MTDLIFLGQVPFTDIYIDFSMWLIGVLAVVVITMIWVLALKLRHGTTAWLLKIYVAFLIRQQRIKLKGDSNRQLV